jgi:hypothetical protein
VKDVIIVLTICLFVPVLCFFLITLECAVYLLNFGTYYTLNYLDFSDWAKDMHDLSV